MYDMVIQSERENVVMIQAPTRKHRVDTGTICKTRKFVSRGRSRTGDEHERRDLISSLVAALASMRVPGPRRNFGGRHADRACGILPKLAIKASFIRSGSFETSILAVETCLKVCMESVTVS